MEEYFRPIIHSVDHFDSFLALAQSGVQEINLGPSSDQYADDESDDSCDLQGDLQVSFNVAGITPTSSGVLQVTVSGDLDGDEEYYTIAIEGQDLSPTIGQTDDEIGQCDAELQETFQIPMASLVAAAQDGVIIITATPSEDVDCFCADSEEGGDYRNRITATLSFEGTTN